MQLRVIQEGKAAVAAEKDQNGRYFWTVPPGEARRLILRAEGEGPCILSGLRMEAADGSACPVSAAADIQAGSMLVLRQGTGEAEVLIPENCLGKTLRGEAWITPLPAGHPLPEALLALAAESRAPQTPSGGGQTPVGQFTYPAVERTPQPGEMSYLQLQTLYASMLSSTSWRVTAPLRAVKDRLKSLLLRKRGRGV